MTAEIKVSATTHSQQVANSIYKAVIAQVEQDDEVNLVVRAIAPVAINNAIKGIIIARGTLALKAIDIAIVPGFNTIPDRDDPEQQISVVILRLIWLH